jgi:hypothetical protein
MAYSIPQESSLHFKEAKKVRTPFDPRIHRQKQIDDALSFLKENGVKLTGEVTIDQALKKLAQENVLSLKQISFINKNNKQISYLRATMDSKIIKPYLLARLEKLKNG